MCRLQDEEPSNMEVEEEAREEEATDGGASERVAADGTWEAAFWDASCEHPKQQVLFDVLHAMKRIRDTIPAQHTLRDWFMSRFRDLLFCVNDSTPPTSPRTARAPHSPTLA